MENEGAGGEPTNWTFLPPMQKVPALEVGGVAYGTVKGGGLRCKVSFTNNSPNLMDDNDKRENCPM